MPLNNLIKKTKFKDFGFATITSSGYIEETVGLIGNLKKIYPKLNFYICTIDNISKKFFSTINNVYTFHGEEVWGEEHWINLNSRMLKREVAYSSKSAFITYLLEKHLKSLILLDSDILILSKIDDLIKYTKNFDALLVPARHSLEDWKRTNQTGLFSAGVMGFNQNAIKVLNWWKKECFDFTIMNEYSGYYNEQKYLDYLVGHLYVKILRDEGINVSATILKKIEPYFSKTDKCWYSKNKIKIRLFHQSRATNHPIYEEKEKFYKSGCQIMNITNYERNRGKSVTIFKGRVNIVVTFFKIFYIFFENLFFFSIYLKRFISNKNFKILKFIKAIRRKKNLKSNIS